MKALLALILMTLFSNNCFSQLLEGEWKGWFSTTYSDNYPITLTFVYEKDNTYNIKSYSETEDRSVKDRKIVCEVEYRIVGTDSIYLAETAVLTANVVAECPQQMFLRIRTDKKQMILEGDWESKQCNLYGTIRFTKKE